MKNPSRLFIIRPVATTLLILALLLVGIVAYRELPVSALPQVDYPTIQVATLYPGASQEVMTSFVTAPLERQLGKLPGLNQMISSSSHGASVITLQFNLALNLDIAEQQVQAAINAAANLLPDDLPMPPIFSKVNPADTPILTLAMTSATLPLPQIEDLVESRLAQKISQVSGVGLVSISGGQRPAVRIQANPLALAAYNLSLEDLRTSIANANVNQPKGSFEGANRSAVIDANDQIRSASEYAKLVVAYRNGKPIHLSDIAVAKEDRENTRLAAWANNASAVIVNIQRQPGTNIIEVVDRIKQRLPQLQQGLPPDLKITVLTDRSITIRASVEAVKSELLIALVLVVLVIFLFLRNAFATLIPAIVVPLSLVGTFAVMYLANFSINNLTLMALTIATGFVVDDAIVVIENINRYLEKGFSPHEAALKGSEQVAFTIISLTFSLIAVLIPLLLMGDVVGRLFREFAITLAVAILLSAIISLTLTPMMCAKLLRPVSSHPKNDFYLSSGRLIEKTTAGYGKALNWSLDHPRSILFIATITLVLTFVLFLVVPRGFFPLQDTGVIQGIAEAPASLSFSAMSDRQNLLVNRLLKEPAIESVSSFVGVDSTNPTLNAGRITLNLKPKADRNSPVDDIIHRIQTHTQDLPGMTLYLQPVQDLTLENRVSRNQYQLTLDANSPEELSHWTSIFIQALAKQPQFSSVTSDLQDQGLQAFIAIDRDTASRLGVSIAAIDNALYDAFGQRPVSTIFTQSNQYRVVLEVQPAFRRSLDDLQNFRVASANRTQVPLSSIATLSTRSAPLVTHHLAQFPASTISFNLAPAAYLSDAKKAIERTITAVKLPPNVQLNYQGTLLAFNSSLKHTLWLILAAIVTVYIVLGVLYESFIHPITILSTLPSAALGALLALILTDNDLGIIAVIGIILLIGIVKKNAIMMIDFAIDAQRGEGKPARDAIFQACLLRFRPIMMTSMAALFSAIPLMLGTGTGSELRHPLGLTLVGGLLVSQLLTLFTTPVFYLVFDTLRERFAGSQSLGTSRPETGENIP